MSRSVFDASAVLALLNREPGRDRVHKLLDDAAISSVNLSEVVAKLIDRGLDRSDIEGELRGLGLELILFDWSLALHSGELRRPTRALGLSFGDRACIATAMSLGAPAVTTDRAWVNLEVGVKVITVR